MYTDKDVHIKSQGYSCIQTEIYKDVHVYNQGFTC